MVCYSMTSKRLPWCVRVGWTTLELEDELAKGQVTGVEAQAAECLQ